MYYFKKEPQVIFCHQHFNFRKQLPIIVVFGAQKFVLATLFELVHCSILNLNILVCFWLLRDLAYTENFFSCVKKLVYI